MGLNATKSSIDKRKINNLSQKIQNQEETSLNKNLSLLMKKLMKFRFSQTNKI